MNKENAHLYLPLVQALTDGKTIQAAFHSGTKDVTNKQRLERITVQEVLP